MHAIWKALGYNTTTTDNNQSPTNEGERNEEKTAKESFPSSKPFSNRSALPTLRHLHQSTSTSSSIPQTSATILQSNESLFKELASTSLLTSNPQDFGQEWTLMFSTNEHGRSFPRFVTAIGKVKGPTLIIIHEEDFQQQQQVAIPSTTDEREGEKEKQEEKIEENEENPEESTTTTTLQTHHSGNIFGCITFTPWDNVRTREMNAKAANAAKARAERTGVAVKSTHQYSSNKSHPSAASTSPPPQAPQFFGNDQCVVFRKNSSINNKSETQQQKDENEQNQDKEEECTEFFHPRPSSSSLANANFMYFFDTHPNSSAVGIGVGGNGARSSVGNEAGMSFFVDRSLSRAESCTGGCVTFQYCNEQLCKNPDGRYKIKSLEVWALNPETIEQDYDQFLPSSSQQNHDENNNAVGFSSPALDSKHATAKAIFELNGGKLWTENSEREDV